MQGKLMDGNTPGEPVYTFLDNENVFGGKVDTEGGTPNCELDFSPRWIYLAVPQQY